MKWLHLLLLGGEQRARARERMFSTIINLFGTPEEHIIRIQTYSYANFVQRLVDRTGLYGNEMLHLCSLINCQPRHTDTLFTFRSKRKQRRKRIRVTWLTQNSIHYLCSADILQNGATVGCRGGDKLLNKVAIFVFFCTPRYSRSFAKLRLNSWCHMDYFTDVLAMFLSLDLVRIIAVYRGSESSQNASEIS